MEQVVQIDARRRNRGGSHHKWVNAVISRDKETCQHCGVTGVELHAHHIKSFKDYPALRFEIENGLTLCFRCHWNVHSAKPVNPVNSVKTLTGGAEGNTEPNLVRNYEEGVTDRGRAYRRWQGNCEQCGTFISKRLSDTTGKNHLFCSSSCSGKFMAAHRSKDWARKHSAALLGKKLSVETRAKMSAAQYRRQANAKAVMPPRARDAKAMSCPEL